MTVGVTFSRAAAAKICAKSVPEFFRSLFRLIVLQEFCVKFKVLADS